MTTEAQTRAQRGRERASAAIQLSRFDEAIREAGLAIAADPAAGSSYALLGQAFLAKSDFAAAQTAADDGLKVDPNSNWLHRLRGMAQLGQGFTSAALESAQTALRLDPNQSLSHSFLGRVLIKARRKSEALPALEKALELAPTDAYCLRELANLLLDSQPVEAERLYLKSLAIEPNSGLALNNLGVALQKQKRAEDAALAFKAAILADPTLAAAKRNAHATVSNLTRVVAGGAIGAWVIIRLGLLGSSAVGGGAAGAGPLAVIALIAAAGYYAFRVSKSRKAKARLNARDPQLLQLFDRLQADKKAGRI